MKKLKKILCLLLSALMILSIQLPAFAMDEIQPANSTGTQTSTGNSALQIEISTDKYKYSALGIATITAVITNISSEDIQNVSAEAVFTDLAPVKRNSTIKAETDTLKPGESLSLSYKATLNKDEHNLNFIQRIFLWLIRLFNGGFIAKDNGFNDGRDYAEKTDTLTFGKFEADNVIRVWYGEKDISDADFDKQIQEFENVQNEIDDFRKSDEYINGSTEDKISLMQRFLNDLEAKGDIQNVRLADYSFSFELKNGWTTGVEIENRHEDCYQSATSAELLENTRYETAILTSTEIPYQNKYDGKWTFSVGTVDSCYSIQELANQYVSLGISIERKESATVQTYTEFADSEFIYIQSHGSVNDEIPMIATEELATKEKQKQYKKWINNGDIQVRGSYETNIWYFYILPSFFENNYKNNELSNAIIYIGSCEAFGTNNAENMLFYNSFKKAGASTVIGFCNSVNRAYSNYFAEKLLYYMSLGYTVGNAFEQTKIDLGGNNNIFWEQYGTIFREKDEFPAYPICCGEKDIKLFNKQINGLGTFTATVFDEYTNKPIEEVAVEIKANANTELFHLLKTSANGNFTINLPEGNYTCSLIHKNYVRKDFEFEVEENNNIVMLDSYYLTPTTYLMGTVLDKATDEPIENASILLRWTDEETGIYTQEFTCSTDKEGNFSISVPVGTYTYEINKLDLLEELYEPATGTVTIEPADGYIMGTVYLTSKASSDNNKVYDIPTTAVEFNGHYYQLYNESLTWAEAKEYCESLGGHLVTITSQEEQSFVENLLDNAEKNSYWLGGYKVDNCFLWITDETFSYTNWARTMPDNQHGNENALMLYNNINPKATSRKGQWNDLKDDGTCGSETFFGVENFGFICEWE